MDAEFDDLKREFLAEASLKVLDIRDAITTKTSDSFPRIGYLAHQLKGSGGSYGFQTISSEAAEIEQAVEKMAGENLPAMEQEIERRVKNLTEEIDRRIRELAPEATV